MDKGGRHRRACSSRLAGFEHPYSVTFGHRAGRVLREIRFDTLK
jgi:hypothetical protein